MIFEELHTLKSGGTTNEFVGEFGLVLIAAAAVDLLVSVLGFSWCGCQSIGRCSR